MTFPTSETPLADVPQYDIVDVDPPKKDNKDKTERRSTRTNPAANRGKKPPLPPWKDGVISGFMEQLYETAGDIILPYSEPYGYAFKGIAEGCGQAWEACAKDSPALRRFIHSLMSASNFSKLAAAHMPLFIVALHQHGPLRQVTDDIAAEYADAA